jgi:hypothetical protein
MTAVRLFALVSGAWMLGTSAFAQGPVAIVEKVTGHPAGVAFMDYVETGKVISLGARDEIVLSYFKSCVREVIRSGSTATVGVDQSDVRSGRVERSKVDCDASKMLLAPGQADDAAGVVFRGPPDPQFTLYGRCPLVEVRGSGTLVIERLDKPTEKYALPIGQKQLLGGAFFDFAANGKSLTAGGTYDAAWNATHVVFRVDPGAKLGRTAIAGRLLRFEPVR